MHFYHMNTKEQRHLKGFDYKRILVLQIKFHKTDFEGFSKNKKPKIIFAYKAHKHTIDSFLKYNSPNQNQN